MNVHVNRSSLVPIESMPELSIFFPSGSFGFQNYGLKQSPGNKTEHQYPGCGCELNSQGKVELERVG